MMQAQCKVMALDCAALSNLYGVAFHSGKTKAVFEEID